jgi:hypothetical protein
MRSFFTRIYWRVMARAEPVDPTPAVARLRFRDEPNGALLVVYRHANASNVTALLADAPPSFGRYLWALDSPHPSLAKWTIGCGRGPRSRLLNRLVGALPDGLDGWVVIADDDVVLTAGRLPTFLAAAAAAGLGLAQPAHDRFSEISHWLTAARRLSIARLTTFVEIGPLVAVAPAWRDRFLPLDDDDMGWGLDLRWSDARTSGCRIGIVDACRMRHLAPVVGTASYDVVGLRLDMEPLYDARGGYERALRTLATWRPWRRRPPGRRTRT